MVFNLAAKFPLQTVRISRVVVLSGLLTFMYCIEFCIGIRTIYYTFKVWSDPAKESKRVSWTLCVACLFTAVISSFSVNLLSAIWEQKQLEEKEKEKSTIRFTFHIIVGGMIWRYINLWCIESKEFQKKGALLLTMIKFFFTQTFTIPLVIVHVSVMEQFDELIFDICNILCISVNLILTCTMFAWCSKEVEELKKWDFVTVDLVPLIFQSEPKGTDQQISTISNQSLSKDVSKPVKKSENKEKEFEDMIIKFIVFFQSFGFSIGRLLALGILLKLAGIYAVSIMFLQLLVSVIYLKFQSPILVSDSLPKWRQLSRLAFMSYILIFEWHLNRDPKTAYDFSSNMKHSIFYYCIATIESVFYLVTWAITTSFASKSELRSVASEQNRFCRIILVIGSLSLVFSLTIHMILLFWRSRRISSFIYSVRRRYETTKLHLSKYGGGKDKDQRSQNVENVCKRSHIDISSPIPIKKTDTETNQEGCELEKNNSYRDLREPLDDEIEIYFRKCESKGKNNSLDKTPDDARQITMSDEVNEFSHASIVVKTIDDVLHRELNNFQTNATEICGNLGKSPTTLSIEKNESLDIKNKKEIEERPAEHNLKFKITSFSDSFTEQWGKVSSVSRKFAGTMKDQIHKRKEQFQNFRNNSDPKKSGMTASMESFSQSVTTEETSNSGAQTPNEDVEVTEGYFMGDSRCYQEESLQSVHTIDAKRIRFLDEISPQGNFEKEDDEEVLPASNVNHKEGDSPCPCYICRTLGDVRFQRRRSSSVPPADRKTKQEEAAKDADQSLPRYMSSPNISQSRCEKKRYDIRSRENEVSSSPLKTTKAAFNLSLLSLDNRVEHYV